MADYEQNNVARQQEKGEIKEQPFNSSVPFFGPIIVRLRTAWYNVAAKWAIRSLILQQNEFNALMTSNLEDHVYEQLIEQDREQTVLIREMGELGLQVKHLIRAVEAMDARLARLEEANGIDGELGEE